MATQTWAASSLSAKQALREGGGGLLFASQKWRRRRGLLPLSLRSKHYAKGGVGCFSPHKNGDADVGCFLSLCEASTTRRGGWAAFRLTKMATQTWAASSLSAKQALREGGGGLLFASQKWRRRRGLLPLSLRSKHYAKGVVG